MGTKKHCEDCGKPTEGWQECRCNSCQEKWQKKRDDMMGKIFSLEPEEKKPNKHKIKHLYFDIGYTPASISQLLNVPEDKVKEILDINNHNKT